jgi:hypothetical protein
MRIMSILLFFVALMLLLCKKTSDNKKFKDYIKKNDADPYSHCKSNAWYAAHPEERVRL